MSNAFSAIFEKSIEGLANTLNIRGDDADKYSRFSEVPVTASFISPGDILFFKYKSTKYGEGDHVTMVIANKRSSSGIFIGNKKMSGGYTLARNYLSAVKLNNIWSVTADLIRSAYKDSLVKYRATPTNKSFIGPAPWIALVGRPNYRTYIVNGMYNVHRFNEEKKELDV